MSDNKIKIYVDGRLLPANKGQMLIEVTDTNDIYIPRFCYHNKLSVAANCRMCLVEIEKAPKLLPACATPVIDGMKVKTQSKTVISAQKAVMEFLLINHPLDCPICDQGGECELQDLAMGYGHGISRYQEKKRVVKDKNIGPLIQTELTRCIHCTRCIRFGEEIAGLKELGATGRGENMTIGTYIEKSVTSELSGNVIDLCPVGALTSKPFRYSARSWELTQKKAIAPHDSVGSNVYAHVKDNRVRRILPAENHTINEVWLSDRDRFSYEAIYSDDRLQSPMIKRDTQWETVDWEIALTEVKTRLTSLIESDGAETVNVLASPSSTLEELYLLQKLTRALGSHNIDSRLRQIDFSDQDSAPLFPWLGKSILELESVDSILLVGSNVRKDQPMINHRLRKSVLNGANCAVINSIDYDFNYPISTKIIVSPEIMVDELASILKALVELAACSINGSVESIIENVSCSDIHRNIADRLIHSNNSIVLLGNLAVAHLQFSQLRALAGLIAKFSDSSFGYLSEAANMAGSWLAGAVPHRLAGGEKNISAGMSIDKMLRSQSSAYILMGVEPELDCWDSLAASEAMRDAKLVVSLTAYRSAAMETYSDIMLPISVFAETSGTYINNEGTPQSFTGVVSPLADARPTWKVLRVLGNYFDLNGFDYQSSMDILAEVMNKIGTIKGNNLDQWLMPSLNKPTINGLQRITELPMNMIDPLCRRAKSLQSTDEISDGAIHINFNLAHRKQLNHDDMARVDQNNAEVIMNVVIDDRVPDDCVLIQAAHPAQFLLGPASGSIKIAKV